VYISNGLSKEGIICVGAAIICIMKIVHEVHKEKCKKRAKKQKK